MFELDTGEKGLPMFFKGWQLKVLEYLWSIQPSGANSREVWSHLQETMPEPVSRASVINFLQDMAEKGVLTQELKTGKGGHRGIYYHKYNETEFKQYIAEYIIRKLLNEFPVETQKALEVTH